MLVQRSLPNSFKSLLCTQELLFLFATMSPLKITEVIKDTLMNLCHFNHPIIHDLAGSYLLVTAQLELQCSVVISQTHVHTHFNSTENESWILLATFRHIEGQILLWTHLCTAMFKAFNCMSCPRHLHEDIKDCRIFSGFLFKWPASYQSHILS